MNRAGREASAAISLISESAPQFGLAPHFGLETEDPFSGAISVLLSSGRPRDRRGRSALSVVAMPMQDGL